MTDNYDGPERRQRHSVDIDELVQRTVRTTVQELHNACLAPDEQSWVRMAIAREARREKLQQAVIEKTLAGLTWAALVVICTAVWNYGVHAWQQAAQQLKG